MLKLKNLKDNPLSRSRLLRSFCSELLGSYLLVFTVISALTTAAIGEQKKGEVYASVMMATMGAGMGIMIALYTAFGVSGGHVNPVVTVALFAIGEVQVINLFLYQVAQYLGGFLAVSSVYFLYSPLLDEIDGGQRVAFGPNGTAHIFITMPHPDIGEVRAFCDQLLTSGIFLIIALACVDHRNLNMPRYLQPFVVSMAVIGIVQCTFRLGGTTITTARDFPSRILLYMVGYGSEVFTAQNYAFWLPLIGPQIGGVMGAWIYRLVIGWPLEHMRKEEELELQIKNDEAKTALLEKEKKINNAFDTD